MKSILGLHTFLGVMVRIEDVSKDGIARLQVTAPKFYPKLRQFLAGYLTGWNREPDEFVDEDTGDTVVFYRLGNLRPTKEQVIDYLLDGDDYNLRVREILAVFFNQNPERLKEWQDWFEGNPPKV